MNLDEARKRVLGWDKPVDKTPLCKKIIRTCHQISPKSCGKSFGTVAGYKAHWGKRGCKTEKALIKEGMWKGHGGIWWTKDLGHDDTEMDWFMAAAQKPYPPV